MKLNISLCFIIVCAMVPEILSLLEMRKSSDEKPLAEVVSIICCSTIIERCHEFCQKIKTFNSKTVIFPKPDDKKKCKNIPFTHEKPENSKEDNKMEYVKYTFSRKNSSSSPIDKDAQFDFEYLYDDNATKFRYAGPNTIVSKTVSLGDLDMYLDIKLQFKFTFRFVETRKPEDGILQKLFGNSKYTKVNLMDSFLSKYWKNYSFKEANVYLWRNTYEAWLELQKTIKAAEDLLKEDLTITIGIPAPSLYLEMKNDQIQDTAVKYMEGHRVVTTIDNKKADYIKYFYIKIKGSGDGAKEMTFYIINKYIEDNTPIIKPCFSTCAKYKWFFSTNFIYCCDPDDQPYATVKRNEKLIVFPEKKLGVYHPLVIKFGDKENLPELVWTDSGGEDNNYFFYCTSKGKLEGTKFIQTAQVRKSDTCERRMYFISYYKTLNSTGIEHELEVYGIALSVENNLSNPDYKTTGELDFYKSLFVPKYNLWFIPMWKDFDTGNEYMSIYKYVLILESAKRTEKMDANILKNEPPNWTSACTSEDYFEKIYSGDNIDRIISKNSKTDLQNTEKNYYRVFLRETKFIRNATLVSPYDMMFEGFESIVGPCTGTPMWSSILNINWFDLEQNVRYIARTLEEDITVYTGYSKKLTFAETKKTFSLTEEMKGIEPLLVYGIVWKLVVTSNGSVLLYVINDIFPLIGSKVFRRTESLCTDACTDFGLDYSKFKGYTKCCKFEAMNKLWKNLPKIFSLTNEQKDSLQIVKKEETLSTVQKIVKIYKKAKKNVEKTYEGMVTPDVF